MKISNFTIASPFPRRLRRTALALLLLTPVTLFSQTAGDSVPAGYHVLTAAGTGGAGGAKLSFHAPGLTPGTNVR